VAEDIDTGAEATELAEIAVVLARALRVHDARLQPTLDAIVAVAAELSGFDAGLVLVERGRLIPQAATGRAPHLLDVVQQERNTGPCIDAAECQEPVRMDDARADDRWDGFGDHAAQVGVVSMLCLPLWIDERLVGTLSLYSDRPAAFSEQDERIAMMCATLAAAALADAQRSEQMRAALVSRDLIGQAKGILIERRKITPDQAFAVLVDVSQHRNCKLTVVARHLVETGELLGEGDGSRQPARRADESSRPASSGRPSRFATTERVAADGANPS
jgi:GAF domain-containing protein